MALDSHHVTGFSGGFQRLSLSIPAEAESLKIIRKFLLRLLNLKDENRMLEADISTGYGYDMTGDEILPNIMLPNDIWLIGEIVIKDVKIKTSMLQDINSMIESILESEDDSAVDENVLNYFEKLLSAYKFTEVQFGLSSTSSVYIPGENALREEEEDEDDNATKYRDNGNGGDMSLSGRASITSPRMSFSASPHSSWGQPHLSSQVAASGPNNNGGKRISSFSRDSVGTRRRFSILGHNEQEQVGASTPVTPTEDDPKKQQVLNSILAKSRIYNKIKKHRESSSSMNSNASIPSVYSNRNSTATVNTTYSSSSRRRSSLNHSSPDGTESRITSITSIVAPNAMTLMQKQENQRIKYEYYLQLRKLLQVSEKLIPQTVTSQRKARAGNFIKKNVLKFIVIDTYQMISDYPSMKSRQFYFQL